MRKYLIPLIPLALGFGIATLLVSLPAREYPDPDRHFRTPRIQEYLANGWIWIGATTAVVLFLVLVISDLSSWLMKRAERRALEAAQRRSP